VKLRQDDKDRQNILNWLTEVDYGLRQSDYLSRRQPGTGRWLLESTHYKTWLDKDQGILFCPGIPGAGKTILTSIMIEELIRHFEDDKDIGIAYLYCDFRQRDYQKTQDLLAGLLKQLSQCRSCLPKKVELLYKKHKDRKTRPSQHEISEALRSVISMYSRAFIVIDAIDECQEAGGIRAGFLKEIFNLHASCKVNLFATSRFIPDIMEKFDGDLSIEIRASEEDIQQYLEDHANELRPFVTRAENRKLLEEIVHVISHTVDGMYVPNN
jgi:Cdc6-like AAA superfamily ATPase